jgi:hypothetical protein
MKHVYSPSGSVEAHMLAHMLEQAGIKADIQGEALLGAVGELPAAGLVKIAVANEDYDNARKLILEWEKKNPPEAPSKGAPKTSKSTLVFTLLIGTVFGWLASEQGLIANSFEALDLNKDGKPDLIYHYKNKNALFAESSENDANFDGKSDIITQYDSQGTAISDKADNDFNGTFETITTYKNGNPEKSEVDTDGDGNADIVHLMEHGILTQTQIMNPKTGKVTRINYFKNSFLKSADFDSDGDGVLETHYTYDRYEQIVSTEKKTN